MGTSVINYYANALKIKYSILEEGITSNDDYRESVALLGENAVVNFFIDMDYIYQFLRIDYYKKLTESIIEKKSFNEFVAEVFNVLGHYRNYFAHRGDLMVRFF